MVRSTGWAVHHTSKVIHRLLLVGTGVLVVAGVVVTGSAWRLAQGPIDLAWLANRVRMAMIDDEASLKVSFDRLELAWEGFDKGVDHPLDLRVSGLEVHDPSGHGLVTAPDAHVTLSVAGLLLGRILPRTIEVDHAQLVITREVDGSVHLGQDAVSAVASEPNGDGSDLHQAQDQLASTGSTEHSQTLDILDHLRRAHFRDSEVTFGDRQSGLRVQASGMDVALARAENGRIHGSVKAPLTLGEVRTILTATADFVPGLGGRVAGDITLFRPRAIGSLPPNLTVVSGLDLPIALSGELTFDAAFKLGQIRANAALGTGQIMIGQGAVPVRSGSIALSGTADQLTVTQCDLDLARAAGDAPERVNVTGTVKRVSDRVVASLSAGLDRIDIADLPRLWPVGISRGARQWVIQHVTSGLATHGTASFVIEADRDLHDAVVTKATGILEGSNAVFTWLDDVPAVEQAEYRLTLVDPDTLDIRLLSGRQRVSNRAGDLVIRDGQMRIVGLSLRDQTTDIRVQVDGQITSALALLSEPRLHLLSEHPTPVKLAGGEASVALAFRFPLETNVRIDDVWMHADARLAHARVLDVAGGHTLEDGVFDLGVDKDSLKFKGRGVLASIPITLDGKLDFTSGPPDQIVAKVNVSGNPDAMQLDAVALPVKDIMTGPVATTAVVVQRRSGDGTVAIEGDLTQAQLKIGLLAWEKPKGADAHVAATLLTANDHLTKIDRIRLLGDNLLVNGTAAFTDGHLRSVLLDKIKLGRTQGHGTIHVTSSDVIDVALQGSQIDLVPKLAEKTSGVNLADPPPPMTPAWTVNARFDRALLANGETGLNILAKASGGGETLMTLDLVGTMHTGEGFSARIEPRGGMRHLRVEAKDAGRFLRGMDTIRTLQSGRLTMDAAFERPYGFYPLRGKVNIEDAIAQNSPVLGKLLQAITLYGLVDVLRGPGMTFSSIVIPFRDDGNSLFLVDAHASNPSLGLTAMGRIDLLSGQTTVTGTIVPAYFFNSALGRLPLVGKLFSPEKGGGVFAARFGLEGVIEDPAITINPISALTPGFMRDIFDVLGNPARTDRGTTVKPP